MMKVRRMLTEVLLEVTDDEISSIANSVYHKAKSRQSRGIPIILMEFINFYIKCSKSNAVTFISILKSFGNCHKIT